MSYRAWKLFILSTLKIMKIPLKVKLKKLNYWKKNVINWKDKN